MRSRSAPRRRARPTRQGGPTPRGGHGQLGLGGTAAVARAALADAHRAVVVRHQRSDPWSAVVKRCGTSGTATGRCPGGCEPAVRRGYAPAEQRRTIHVLQWVAQRPVALILSRRVCPNRRQNVRNRSQARRGPWDVAPVATCCHLIPSPGAALVPPMDFAVTSVSPETVPRG